MKINITSLKKHKKDCYIPSHKDFNILVTIVDNHYIQIKSNKYK